MSITIDLPDEVYQRLERHARAQGTTPVEAITQVLEEAEVARGKAFWERLEAKGLVAKRKPAPDIDAELFEPIQVQGKPLSEVIIEERR
jgi:predicted transcriptional regulator